ncbi:hypothetical protein FNF31_02165 [Cafeteria roenbergensis]|nr:hypothetical protein FNF31_02165 [Cafeteria roenbergensis]
METHVVLDSGSVGESSAASSKAPVVELVVAGMRLRGAAWASPDEAGRHVRPYSVGRVQCGGQLASCPNASPEQPLPLVLIRVLVASGAHLQPSDATSGDASMAQRDPGVLAAPILAGPGLSRVGMATLACDAGQGPDPWIRAAVAVLT